MFPVKELFLEDVLELTKFVIKGDATSCPRDGQRDEKGMDPIFKVLKANQVLNVLIRTLHVTIT
jgi:hypothetical protein